MSDIIIAVDDAWLIISGVGAFTVVLGFSILQAGVVEGKSVKSVLMINLAGFTFGGILWYALAFGLFFGSGSVLGIDPKFYFTNDDRAFGMFFHSAGYAITAVVIVSGGIMGRIRFESYLLFSLFFLGFVYPIAGHAAWSTSGFIYKLGFIDFSGGMVTHGLAGYAGLAGAWMVGPRVGRYFPLKPGQRIPTVRPMKNNSAVLVFLGSMLLYVDWFLYNGGQSLTLVSNTHDSNEVKQTGHYAANRAIMNSLICSLFSMCSMMVYEITFKNTRELEKVLNALISGLVMIGAGAHKVSTTDAMILGIISALVYNLTSVYVLENLIIDDPLDSFAIHGACGTFGTLALGFFSQQEGIFHGHDANLLLVQFKGVLILASWGAISAILIYKFIHLTFGLTVSKEEQAIGLDLINHDAAIEELDATQVQEFALRKDMENRLIQQRKKERKEREERRNTAGTSVLGAITKGIKSNVKSVTKK